MNDHDLDVLLRQSLERDAATQPLAVDLHQRSVAYGRRVTRRRRAAGAGVTALVVAAVAVTGATLAGTGKHPQPSAPPAPTLTSIAAHVRALSDAGQRTSPWWYSRTSQTVGTQTDVYEDWLPRAQSDSVVIRVLRDGVPGQDPVSKLQDGASSSVSGWGVYAQLPFDATVLLRSETDAATALGPGASADAVAAAKFEAIVPLLELGEFPPAQRSAALTAVAMIKGVVLGGKATDAAGRTGVVLRPPDVGFGAGRSYLLDPSTGLVLQATQTDAQTGVTTRTTFVASAGVADAYSVPSELPPVAHRGDATSTPLPRVIP